jgi:ZIP family zinc transporter
MMLNDLWTAALFGTLSGIIGTAAGGFLAFFIPERNKKAVSFILEYSGGLMTAVVCFDLLPSSFSFASLPIVIIGMLCGVGLMLLSESVIDAGSRKLGKYSTIRSTGLAIAVGVALHNFPEGLAVGSGLEADVSLGLSLALAIMLHDVPEGISISVPLTAGGTSRLKALLLTLASGLPMGVGALFGAWVGRLSTVFIAMCLSVAGGAMLYVIFADMIPESKRTYSGRFGSIGSILGIVSGIIVSVQLKG